MVQAPPDPAPAPASAAAAAASGDQQRQQQEEQQRRLLEQQQKDEQQHRAGAELARALENLSGAVVTTPALADEALSSAYVVLAFWPRENDVLAAWSR